MKSTQAKLITVSYAFLKYTFLFKKHIDVNVRTQIDKILKESTLEDSTEPLSLQHKIDVLNTKPNGDLEFEKLKRQLLYYFPEKIHASQKKTNPIQALFMLFFPSAMVCHFTYLQFSLIPSPFSSVLALVLPIGLPFIIRWIALLSKVYHPTILMGAGLLPTVTILILTIQQIRQSIDTGTLTDSALNGILLLLILPICGMTLQHMQRGLRFYTIDTYTLEPTILSHVPLSYLLEAQIELRNQNHLHLLHLPTCEENQDNITVVVYSHPLCKHAICELHISIHRPFSDDLMGLFPNEAWCIESVEIHSNIASLLIGCQSPNLIETSNYVKQLHYFHESQNTSLYDVTLKNIYHRNLQFVVNNHEAHTEIGLFDLILSHLKSQNEHHPYIPTTLMLRYLITAQFSIRCVDPEQFDRLKNQSISHLNETFQHLTETLLEENNLGNIVLCNFLSHQLKYESIQDYHRTLNQFKLLQKPIEDIPTILLEHRLYGEILSDSITSKTTFTYILEHVYDIRDLYNIQQILLSIGNNKSYIDENYSLILREKVPNLSELKLQETINERHILHTNFCEHISKNPNYNVLAWCNDSSPLTQIQQRLDDLEWSIPETSLVCTLSCTVKEPPLDLDLFTFLLQKDGLCKEDTDLIFYNQIASPDGSVHLEDTIAQEQTSTVILNLDLSKLSDDIQAITIACVIDSAHTPGIFQDVSQCNFTISSKENTMLTYDLLEVAPEESSVLIFGHLKRRHHTWKFIKDKKMSSSSVYLCQRFGINVG